MRVNHKKRQIAIDGPAGAGKTEVATAVARRLGLVYLDTGAMYRTVAAHLMSLTPPVDLADEASVTPHLKGLSLEVAHGFPTRVWCNGREWTGEIRTPEIAMGASTVSQHHSVRAYLISMQQRLANVHAVVMEGRDICSVVLPDAAVKVFLTAKPGVRGQRRWEQMGRKTPLAAVEADIIMRDTQDMSKGSKLHQAEDATLIDSTDLTLDQVVDRIVSLAMAHPAFLAA